MIANWIPTPTSSNLTRFGYDAATQTLGVTFKGGTTYIYSGVPESVFIAMQSAPSQGQYFNANVKGKYSHITQ